MVLIPSSYRIPRLQYLLQLLNLTFFVGNNSFILAHPCHWFAPLPTAFSFMRSTCINTTLALLHVFAVGTQPWVDRAGMSYHCKSLFPSIFCSTNSSQDRTSQKGCICMLCIQMSSTSTFLVDICLKVMSINIILIKID